jgi:beta-galactosidase GanA
MNSFMRLKSLKYCTILCIFFLSILLFSGEVSSQPFQQLPHLKKSASGTSLMVKGKPFLIRGGELGNSTAADLGQVHAFWPKLHSLHMNTVLVPVYWELMEPEEGRFDFSLLDSILQDARKEDMHLVLLWFGSWKNSMSCYVPAWVKSDYKRFPRARNSRNEAMEILTPFSTANMQADIKAFRALMKHLKAFDREQSTVIMIQVENEIGMIPDARDYHPDALKAFAGAVPNELMAYLVKNREYLTPELKDWWKTAGNKPSGSWEQVFGKGTTTEELFMAWHFALYTGEVARAGKEEYPLPMFVNAALSKPGQKPGEYPSAGPLPHLFDLWRAGAPAIDFYAADIYNPFFKEWLSRYNRQGNIIFIPEIFRSRQNGANALYLAGEYDGLGFSPFAIESHELPSDENLAEAYGVLEQLESLIHERPGSTKKAGVLLGYKEPTRELVMGNYRFHFSLELLDRYADKRNASDSSYRAGGILIQLSDDEFILAGTGLIVTVEPVVKNTIKAGISSVDAGIFEKGEWKSIQRLNGDQTHQGRHVRLPNTSFSILRLYLYQYQ